MSVVHEVFPKTATVYVAGHTGLVGSSVVRALKRHGFHNLKLATSKALDLRVQKDVEDFFSQEKPEFVFLCAAKVGGILANHTHPAEFIYDNLMMSANVIHQAFASKVRRLIFLGSSCIYPKEVAQPIQESYLLQGPLEPTNRPYAVAKIAGLELCEAYRRQYGAPFLSVMPTNLFGPNDSYDLQNSHVLPALLRKIHEAKINKQKTVEIWGSGLPRREFLYSDDLAEALLFLMQLPDSSFHALAPFVNVGSGKDISIKDLALLIANIVGFDGDFTFDRSKPDGTMRKLLDVSRLQALGWQPTISLEEGIQRVYYESGLCDE